MIFTTTGILDNIDMYVVDKTVHKRYTTVKPIFFLLLVNTKKQGNLIFIAAYFSKFKQASNIQGRIYL